MASSSTRHAQGKRQKIDDSDYVPDSSTSSASDTGDETSSQNTGETEIGAIEPEVAAIQPQVAQAGAPPMPYVALHPHAWLHFPMDDAYYDRLRVIARKQFFPLKTIDWSLIRTVGALERMKAIFTPVWRRLLDTTRPGYRELTIEFYSTFKFHDTGVGLHYARAMEFRLGGVDRSLSITQFARVMGIYSEEELQQPLYRDSLLAKDVSNVVLCTWWPTIADGALHGTTRASWIRDPLHRYTHRIIAHTIAGRGESRERVTFTDAFLLYCLLHPASCNIAVALASDFEAHRGRPVASQLDGGAFITRLAEGLDIDTAGLTPVPSRLLDLTAIRQMDIVERIPGGGTRLTAVRASQPIVIVAPDDTTQAGVPTPQTAGGEAPLQSPVHFPPPPPVPRIRPAPPITIQSPQ
ncbi:hypothetical protein R6Q59_028091 [Mikania micrantha]